MLENLHISGFQLRLRLRTEPGPGQEKAIILGWNEEQLIEEELNLIFQSSEKPDQFV